MNFIVIEPMALASDLADAMAVSKLGQDAVYMDDPDTPNQTIYTEEAQNIFDEHYDDFLSIINRNEIKREIR